MVKTKKRVNAEIISNQKLYEDYFLMEMESKWLASKSKPGQFVNIKVKDNATDPLLRVPLCIENICPSGISVFYKVIGDGTRLLSLRKKGEEIDVLGPLGNGFEIKPYDIKERYFLVGGGYGVAALYPLAKDLVGAGSEVYFFIGGKRRRHIVLEKEVRKVSHKVFITTEDGSCGEKGLVTETLEKELRRVAGSAPQVMIYACGPNPMLAAVTRVAKKFKIPCQVSYEEYMACGIGACRGCAVDTIDGIKLTCKDGPIFDGYKIKWI